MARLEPVRDSRLAALPVILAPEAPNGCPMAIAPVEALITAASPGAGLKLNVPPVSPVIVDEAVVHPVDAIVNA